MLFEEKTDGERVYDGKRLEKYGLTLHETKTRCGHAGRQEGGRTQV